MIKIISCLKVRSAHGQDQIFKTKRRNPYREDNVSRRLSDVGR